MSGRIQRRRISPRGDQTRWVGLSELLTGHPGQLVGTELAHKLNKLIFKRAARAPDFVCLFVCSVIKSINLWLWKSQPYNDSVDYGSSEPGLANCGKVAVFLAAKGPKCHRPRMDGFHGTSSSALSWSIAELFLIGSQPQLRKFWKSYFFLFSPLGRVSPWYFLRDIYFRCGRWEIMQTMFFGKKTRSTGSSNAPPPTCWYFLNAFLSYKWEIVENMFPHENLQNWKPIEPGGGDFFIGKFWNIYFPLEKS